MWNTVKNFCKTIQPHLTPSQRRYWSSPSRLTPRQREIEEYLSKSVDRYDLERRERELERKGYFNW
jgi:hypothetical protein